MSKELIRQLKSLKHDGVKPNELWLKKNRELLLSQIKNTVSANQKQTFTSENIWQGMSIFLPQSIVYKVVRPVVAIVLIFVMGLGGLAATVSASSESLPGEWLYPAKRAVEKTQATLANVIGNKTDVVELHGEFALRRAKETNELVKDPKKVQIASETVKDLREEIKTINTNLEQIKKVANPTTGADVAKNINQDTQKISVVLKEVKVNLQVNNERVATDLSSQVSEVKSLVNDISLKAVETMVEEHLKGNSSLSQKEVEGVIDTQLKLAVEDVAKSTQNIVEVNKVVEVVKSEVDAVTKDGTSMVSKNATQVITDKLAATSKQTQAAITTAHELNIEVGKTATEGQVLLSEGNLVQAVDKIKEISATNARVDQLTDNTIKAVQTILPVVAVTTDPAVGSIILATSTSSTIPAIPVITTSTSSTIKFDTSTTPVIVTKPTTSK